jgi:hypothetical protein
MQPSGESKRRGKKRDGDFPEQEKRMLADFAGSRCSNPACRAETKAKCADADKVLNLGIAAHIYGAEPGGARYNEHQSPEERRSAIRNGIWLCEPCATIIDIERTAHPAQLLFQWRQDNERERREFVVQRTNHSGNRKREFGAVAVVLFCIAPITALLYSSLKLALVFATAAAVSLTLSEYYREKEADYARQLHIVARVAAASAAGAVLGNLAWKRVLLRLAPVWMLLAVLSLGIGWSGTAAERVPKPERVADVTETIEVDHPGPSRPAPAPPFRMGATGPPQIIHVMSANNDERDPINLSPVLDGVDQDIVGDPGSPKLSYVGAVKPSRPVGALGMMHIRNMELRAVSTGTSVIGGVPGELPNVEMAPVMIEDSVVDRRIQLASNVFTSNVRFRDF